MTLCHSSPSPRWEIIFYFYISTHSIISRCKRWSCLLFWIYQKKLLLCSNIWRLHFLHFICFFLVAKLAKKWNWTFATITHKDISLHPMAAMLYLVIFMLFLYDSLNCAPFKSMYFDTKMGMQLARLLQFIWYAGELTRLSFRRSLLFEAAKMYSHCRWTLWYFLSFD